MDSLLQVQSRTPVSSGDPAYASVVDFLYLEAALLDDREHRAWLDSSLRTSTTWFPSG